MKKFRHAAEFFLYFAEGKSSFARSAIIILAKQDNHSREA